MKIITIAAIKGGVGKTTCTAFLSQAFASKGARVLVVDLDPQANLTSFYLRNTPQTEINERNVAGVLLDNRRAADSIFRTRMKPTENPVDIIPATRGLTAATHAMTLDMGSVIRLRPELLQLPYDYVILDTQPAITAAIQAAFYSADHVLVPMTTDYWTTGGFIEIRDHMRKVIKDTARQIPISVVPFRVTLSEFRDLTEAPVPWTLLQTPIMKNPAIHNATNAAHALAKDSISELEFCALAKEMETKE